MKHYGTFDEFVAQMRAILDPTAAGKGYSTTGVDGVNALYEFVQDTAGGPGHALGEIIYKARRYGAKGDPVDVLKIASWAFLVWRHHPERDDRAADPPAIAAMTPNGNTPDHEQATYASVEDATGFSMAEQLTSAPRSRQNV